MSAWQSHVLAAVMKHYNGCCLQQHFSEAQAPISHEEQNICCQMIEILHVLKCKWKKRSDQDTK